MIWRAVVVRLMQAAPYLLVAIGLFVGWSVFKPEPQDDVETLLDQLKAEEGWRPFVYKDSQGYATVGYGTCVDERCGGITMAMGEAMERVKVSELRAHVHDLLPWLKAQPDAVRIVCLDIAYEDGAARPAGLR